MQKVLPRTPHSSIMGKKGEIYDSLALGEKRSAVVSGLTGPGANDDLPYLRGR